VKYNVYQSEIVAVGARGVIESCRLASGVQAQVMKIRTRKSRLILTNWENGFKFYGKLALQSDYSLKILSLCIVKRLRYAGMAPWEVFHS